MAVDHPTGWKPIETAPKDGTSIVVWAPAYAVRGLVVGWNSDEKGWENEEGSILRHELGPTLWAPIPQAPESA